MNKKVSIIIISVILVIAFCILAIPYYVSLPRAGFSTIPDYWYETMQWIKYNTPTDAKILSWWDYGYWIEYLSERQSVVDPGQNPEMVQQVAVYFLSNGNPETPDDADYVIVDWLSATAFIKAMKIWAEYYSDYVTDNALVKRLFCYTPESQINLSQYELVFDNGIKVFKFNRLMDVE